MTKIDLIDSLLPSRSSLQLKAIAGDLASAAQIVYDAWEQDDGGFDEEYGAGGICQDIASGLASILEANGIEAVTTFTTIGDNHVYVIAALTDGVWAVDIPPSVYEAGGGYTWTKKPGVTFVADHISLLRIETSILSGDELANMYSE